MCARACVHVSFLVSRCEIRRRRRHPHEHVAVTYFGSVAAVVVSGGRGCHSRVVIVCWRFFAGWIPFNVTYADENARTAGGPGVQQRGVGEDVCSPAGGASVVNVVV